MHTKKKSKKEKRLENKCKKMAALLNITKLNEQDRHLRLAPTAAESVIAAVKQQVQDFIDRKPCADNLSRISPEICKIRPHSPFNDFYDIFVNDDVPVNRKHASTEVIFTNEPPKKQKFTPEDYGKLKEEFRGKRQRHKSIPHIRLKTIGENASLQGKAENENRVPILLSDLQHLLLYSLLGHQSPWEPSRWCCLEKNNKLTHTVVLVVEGLTADHYLTQSTSFSNVNTHLEHRLEIITPASHGGSIAEALAIIPLTGTQKYKLIEQFGSLKAAMQSTGDLVKLHKEIFPIITKTDESRMNIPSSDNFPRTQLILSPWQMLEENYPIPLKGEATKYSEYVMTQDEYQEATADSPMFGLDCEMCRTTTGALELTRVSIVDEKMNLIYDSLVKPDNGIIDYLTQYSGITKEILENVTTKLLDVQEFIRILLPPDAILVGQSLNGDLHSLKMMHPYVIDTSVIFNITGLRGRKSKLQTLAREFLQEKIQEKKSGHCSIEDSQASMKLVRLKLANSIDFGDAVLINQRKIDSHRTSTSQKPAETTTVASTSKQSSKTTAIVGCSDIMDEYSRCLKESSLNIMEHANFGESDNVQIVVTETNTNAIAKASEILLEHALTFCHLRLDKQQLSTNNVNKTVQTVNKWINDLWQGTALHGLVCVVFSGEKNSKSGACFLNVKKEVYGNI